MRTDSEQVLRAWEAGLVAGPRRRATTLLRAFSPHLDDATVRAMPLGALDRELFGIRGALFGEQFVARVRCADCNEQLQIEFAATHVLTAPAPVAPRPVRLSIDDDASAELVIVARPPVVDDLQHAAAAPDARAAQQLVLRRCVESARRADESIDADELPQAALDALGAEFDAADPDAHIELEARCPQCGRVAPHVFDIAAFLWAEIEAEALRLLHDVHRLAAGYGWREADILGMSALRRRAYLEMLTS